MPRLVSLTLLSFLALPAAAVVYLLVFVVGDNAFRGDDDLLFLLGSAASFAVVVAWWTALWARQVRWSGARLAATAAFTLASLVGGLVVGVLAAGAMRYGGGAGFGCFIGGVTADVLWLAGACLVWRDYGQGKPARTADGQAAADVVSCPQCGYALNGLREARCPECGQTYTLDALFAAQRRGEAADLAEAR